MVLVGRPLRRADAGDGETLGTVQRLFDPAFAKVAALIDERDAIETSISLTTAGKAEARAANAAKFAALAAELVPQLTAPVADIQAEIDGLVVAADQGMVRDGAGWLRKRRATSDPVLDGEARSVWRAMDPAKFSAFYREWVPAADARAEIAEADPAGTLVSTRDREWARQYRLAANPQIESRVKVLRAQLRTHGLLTETIQMTLREGAAAAEAVDAV